MDRDFSLEVVPSIPLPDLRQTIHRNSAILRRTIPHLSVTSARQGSGILLLRIAHSNQEDTSILLFLLWKGRNPDPACQKRSRFLRKTAFGWRPQCPIPSLHKCSREKSVRCIFSTVLGDLPWDNDPWHHSGSGSCTECYCPPVRPNPMAYSHVCTRLLCLIRRPAAR